MGLGHSPSIVRDGLVFLVDPANLKSWDGSSAIIKDIIGNRNITKGSNTISSSFQDYNIFAASSDTGTLDTGYRYGLLSNGDKVVDSNGSWTISGWIYKDSSPNNWWHVYTDGSSGDILTIHNVSPYTFRTSMNNSGGNGVWSTGSDISDFGIDWLDLTDGWHNVVLIYDKDNSRLQLIIDTVSSPWQTGRVIHPSYCLRNFYGWGSANSSYHTDADHSLTLVYNRVLTESEIKQNYEVIRGRFGI